MSTRHLNAFIALLPDRDLVDPAVWREDPFVLVSLLCAGLGIMDECDEMKVIASMRRAGARLVVIPYRKPGANGDGKDLDHVRLSDFVLWACKDADRKLVKPWRRPAFDEFRKAFALPI